MVEHGNNFVNPRNVGSVDPEARPGRRFKADRGELHHGMALGKTGWRIAQTFREGYQTGLDAGSIEWMTL